MPELRHVPFADLRRAVEKSHGLLEQDLTLCFLTKGGTSTLEGVHLLTRPDLDEHLEKGGAAEEMLTTRKDRRGKGNQADTATKVTIQPGGVGAVHTYDGRKVDAAFWTEASIEKFFFPYYQRVLDPADFEVLQRRYYAPTDNEAAILAFVHYPPSIYGFLAKSGFFGALSSTPLAALNAAAHESRGIAALTAEREVPLSELLARP